MEENFKKKNIFTIPNALSLFRLLLVPVIVWLYCGKKKYMVTAAVVALSAATDIIDGKIARRFHMISDLGKILDPVADKLTQAALVICLMTRYERMRILLMLFIIKEGMMLLWGYLTLKHTATVNSAKWYGKASTVVLYVVMMLLILIPNISETVANILMLSCACVMLLSLIMYGRFYYQILRKEDLKQGIQWSQSKVFKVILAFIWAALIIACLLHRDDISVERILSYTPSNPWFAAALMMLLFALKSVSVVIYSGILYLVSGILFPLPAAILVNLCGTVVMISVPYFIGRKAGVSIIDSIRQKYPKSKDIHALRKKNDLFFSFAVRIIRMPGDIVSMYMGAIKVEYKKYLAGSMLGIFPHAIIYPIVGMNITNIHSPQFKIALCIEITYIALTTILYVLYTKKHAGDTNDSELRKSLQ